MAIDAIRSRAFSSFNAAAAGSSPLPPPDADDDDDESAFDLAPAADFPAVPYFCWAILRQRERERNMKRRDRERKKYRKKEI